MNNNDASQVADETTVGRGENTVKVRPIGAASGAYRILVAIGGECVALTPGEARQLRDALDALV